MGFPKIKDRLFFTFKEQGVFFMAETTQNELIAKPSFLSSHRRRTSLRMSVSDTGVVCVCWK